MLMKRKINLELGSKTMVIGVLNVTPDSFSDGGLYNNVDKALRRAEIMLAEGARIIDIGGESTRPGSSAISEKEELGRVLPVIESMRRSLGNNFLISIDTYRANVAKQALEEGASLVNSLGGFRFDPNMTQVVKEYGCSIIIYHIRGKPKKMQIGEITYKDVIKDILSFFEKQIKLGISKGLSKEQFLIDPGIGFGKTVEQNLVILKKLSEFLVLDCPIVIGVSRKSHLGTILKEDLKLADIPTPTDRLEASLAETAIAVLNGAKIVRTHDVLQTKKFLTVIDRIKGLS